MTSVRVILRLDTDNDDQMAIINETLTVPDFSRTQSFAFFNAMIKDI